MPKYMSQNGEMSVFELLFVCVCDIVVFVIFIYNKHVKTESHMKSASIDIHSHMLELSLPNQARVMWDPVTFH